MGNNTIYSTLSSEGTIYDAIYSKAKVAKVNILHSLSQRTKGYIVPGVGLIQPEVSCKSPSLMIEEFIDINKLGEIVNNEKDIDLTKVVIEMSDYNKKYDPFEITEADKEIILKLVKLYLNTKVDRNDFFNRIENILTKGTSWVGHLFDHYDEGEGPGGEGKDYKRDIISAYLNHRGKIIGSFDLKIEFS